MIYWTEILKRKLMKKWYFTAHLLLTFNSGKGPQNKFLVSGIIEGDKEDTFPIEKIGGRIIDICNASEVVKIIGSDHMRYNLTNQVIVQDNLKVDAFNACTPL